MWANRLGLSLLMVLPEFNSRWDVLDLQQAVQSQLSRSIFLAELCAEVIVRLSPLDLGA